ncbi:VCBS repeat-containing protein [Halioglobus maricola]|uniref:VCBS repeat-containing protein n=1 Tax=Halioglobus maricola TaxID=2601894 RepID=A0A5P9NMX8_9GAMM|nr:VCBS repeat-containing protein [Halioglobus maricola]QFU76624.1 VCBS repeat-containing protein [Halioglobus maricola]
MWIRIAALYLAILATGAQAQSTIYKRHTIEDSLPGAAFVVAGNLIGGDRPEMVVSSFGELVAGPEGTIIPEAGKLTLFKNASGINYPNGPLRQWQQIPIFDEAAGITFPNRPTLADVDEDGDLDVIVPGGYFFDTFAGNSRGSLTWWENQAVGRRWVRHDLLSNSPFSFHSVLYEDFTGDGIADIVTTGEDAGDASDAFDDVVETMIIPGLGGAEFGAPMTIGNGGGSLLTAYDVNEDGLMDVVSPQFFGLPLGQPFIPVDNRNAGIASFVWFENMGDGSFLHHAIGVDQGPGFAIVPVENLLGDGVTRFIAANHTNQNVAFRPFSEYPEPAVYEFTPADDPRELWSVRTLTGPAHFPVEGPIGQAAPGYLGAGDLNGNGRLDIAVSGDGARGVYWMEQGEDGNFVTRQFPSSDGYGQAGGPVITDLNNSGVLEVVFASFDQNAVSIWAQCDRRKRVTGGLFGMLVDNLSDPGC